MASSKQNKHTATTSVPPKGSVRMIDPIGLRAMIQEHEMALGNTVQSLTKQEEYQIEYHSLLNTLRHLPDKLSHDALVPLGPLAMGHGKLIHTNEITCHIGDNWFVQCSAKTAENIAAHRIQKSNEMLSKFHKEKELITGWIEEGKRQLAESETEGTVEITEVYDEAQEQRWRQQHRENVRRHHQEAAQAKLKSGSDVTTPDAEAQELLDRLELLELEEELSEYRAKQKESKSEVPTPRSSRSNSLPTSERSILKSPLHSAKGEAESLPAENKSEDADAGTRENIPKPETLFKRRVSFDSSKDTIHSYPAEQRSMVITSPVAEVDPREEVVVDAFKNVVIEKTFSSAKKVDAGSADEDESEKPPERMSFFKQQKMMREGKL